jgi:hypothetical protein
VGCWSIIASRISALWPHFRCGCRGTPVSLHSPPSQCAIAFLASIILPLLSLHSVRNWQWGTSHSLKRTAPRDSDSTQAAPAEAIYWVYKQAGLPVCSELGEPVLKLHARFESRRILFGLSLAFLASNTKGGILRFGSGICLHACLRSLTFMLIKNRC